MDGPRPSSGRARWLALLLAAWTGLCAAGDAAAAVPLASPVRPVPLAPSWNASLSAPPLPRSSLGPLQPGSVQALSGLSPLPALLPAPLAVRADPSAAQPALAGAIGELARAAASLAPENGPPSAERGCARAAAVMDGRAAPRPAAAVEVPALPEDQAGRIAALRALGGAGEPILLTWRTKPGRTKTVLAMVTSVFDTTSMGQDGWKTRWSVHTDVPTGAIPIESVISARPAGISAGRYYERIRPKRPASMARMIAQTGLSEEQVALIRAASRGFKSVHGFVRGLPGASKGTLSIGLTDNLDQYNALVRAGGLTHWKTLYEEWFGGAEHPRTEEFMRRVTGTGKPILMFLPGPALDQEYHPNTSDELRWLLAHPDKMENVTFVLGAYDLFSRVDESRLFDMGLRDAEKRRAFLADLFLKLGRSP